MTRFNLDGHSVSLDGDPDMPLLWALRDELGLIGTKYGCGIAACGASTVHIDGEPVRSCSFPLSATEGKQVATIEALSKDRSHPLQRAWIAEQVLQCAYCQPGMLMAAAALHKANPKPSDEDIDAAVTNICRCGTYARIRKAIHLAAGSGP